MSKRLYLLALFIVLFLSVLPISCGTNVFSSEVATLGESGMHVGIGAFAPPYPYAIYVYIKPTSRAVAGTKYDVDLYEKGKLRGTKSITFTQPEINVNSERMVAFPANVDEYNAYYGENINGIFSIKVYEHPLPNITLIYPKGGEVLRVGDVVTIKWESTGLTEDSHLQISLYTDSEMNNQIVIWNDVLNTGSHIWKVENVITTNARIGIVNRNTGISVLSNKFSISGSGSEVSFPDSNLEAAIRKAINKPTGDIYKTELQSLTRLFYLTDKNITNLVGLEYCSNLQILYLSDNSIDNISPLANLTNLTILELNNNEIIDISPLKSLTKLTQLQLSGNQISDISPLSSLVNLNLLQLSGNQIINISQLTSLTKLTSLDLGSNQINDVSSLASLINLNHLNLYNNKISNISSLAYLVKLTGLTLTKNQISDISPISSLTNLSGLDLSQNQISDILVLASLTKLSALNLSHNPLSETSINTYIPQLRSRGISVTY
ncbi:MAG TPA: leucine-rich repeat domain-containing protein [Dehalococcoidales bacterium]